jgi:mRNA interferase MazF
MPGGFVPDRGDLVWLQFDPQVGHEQAGRRPALVLSPRSYNAASGLALLCPITSRIGYPFRVLLPRNCPALELSSRINSRPGLAHPQARLIGPAPAAVIDEVLAKAHSLLD